MVKDNRDYCSAWYSDELLEILNNKGFVHVITKKPVDTGFYKKGRAFFYDRLKKIYQLVDFHSPAEVVRIQRRFRCEIIPIK